MNDPIILSVTLFYFLAAFTLNLFEVRKSSFIALFTVFNIFTSLFCFYLVSNYSPGDFVVYVAFFDACSQSFETCKIVNSFEPLFFFISYLLAKLISLPPQIVWLVFNITTIALISYSIAKICTTFNVKYSNILSLLLIIFSYCLTNFLTLAIRFGFSFSLFMLALSFIYGQPRNRKRGILTITILVCAVLIHYQTIFLLPIAILSYFPATLIPSSFFLNRQGRFFVNKKIVVYTIGFAAMMLITSILASSLLSLLGKSHYLSDYRSSSLGLRSIVEILVLIVLIYPSLLRKLKLSSLIVHKRLFSTSIIFSIYSSVLNYTSLFVLNIDGFARQSQSAFIFASLVYVIISTTNNKYYQLSRFTLSFYPLLISIYTYSTDPSFNPLL